MRELVNKISVTGLLVKKDIKEQTNRKGEECILGSIIIRTSDGSEHEINLYANKFKKDSNKQITSELSYFYKEYVNIMDNFKDIASTSLEEADIVSVSDGAFTANDFLNKNDQKLISSNKIFARFVNKVEQKDIDTTPQTSRFEVEGIIESINQEIIKDIPTGNLVVKLNVINQKADGFGKGAKYEADSLIPIKLIVGKGMADGFNKAGYYAGCFAKFVGAIINTREVVEIVEKQAFGDDKIERHTKINRRYEIKSGNVPSTIFDNELDQVTLDALISKRKQLLNEIKSGVAANSSKSVFGEGSTNTPPINNNPFASLSEQK